MGIRVRVVGFWFHWRENCVCRAGVGGFGFSLARNCMWELVLSGLGISLAKLYLETMLPFLCLAMSVSLLCEFYVALLSRQCSCSASISLKHCS